MKGKRAALLFVAFFCLALVALTFHHHADGLTHHHPECSICFHGSLQSSLAFQDSPSVAPPAPALVPLAERQAASLPAAFAAPYCSRAPPA